ncbi:hypothetical protein D3C87_1162980 [compost metagenome]
MRASAPPSSPSIAAAARRGWGSFSRTTAPRARRWWPTPARPASPSNWRCKPPARCKAPGCRCKSCPLPSWTARGWPPAGRRCSWSARQARATRPIPPPASRASWCPAPRRNRCASCATAFSRWAIAATRASAPSGTRCPAGCSAITPSRCSTWSRWTTATPARCATGRTISPRSAAARRLPTGNARAMTAGSWWSAGCSTPAARGRRPGTSRWCPKIPAIWRGRLATSRRSAPASRRTWWRPC